MPFIHTLGLGNYRGYNEYYEFDFSPITLLTGPNNSGKSSIFKALLLLQKSASEGLNLDNLTFKGGDHFLGYFENVLNQHDQPLHFTLPFRFLNRDDIVIHLKYEKSNLNRIKNYFADLVDLRIAFKQDNSTLLSIKYLPLYESNKSNDSKEDIYNIEIYFDYLTYKEIIISFFNQSPKEHMEESINEFLYNSSFDSYHGYFENFEDSINDLLDNTPNDIEMKLYPFYERVNKGAISLKEDNVFTQFVNKQEIENTYEEIHSIVENISSIFKVNKHEIMEINYYNDYNETIIDIFKYFISHKNKKTKNKKMNEYLVNHISHSFKLLTTNLKNNLSHLSSVRGNLGRLYMAEGNAFNELITEFSELSNESLKITSPQPPLAFVNEWINNFEIDGMKYLEIVASPEYNMNAVYLKKNKKDMMRKPLIDLGFGISQLVVILIKIAVESKRQPLDRKTILIEEPEANLHPKYQSLLADMFIDASFKFGIQFILETHSEYLIRRFQYWIAQGHISNEDISIYNIGKNTSNSETKKLTFDKIGNIKQELGHHFFDEFTTINDELKKIQEITLLKKEKENLEQELNKIKGSAKYFILTEDEDIKLLRLLFISSGFEQNSIQFFSYKGCTQIQVAKSLTKFVLDRFTDLTIIVHRDRDYMTDEELQNWESEIKKSGKLHCFITDGTMVESYFINPDHICTVNKKISFEQAKRCVEQAIAANREYSIQQIKRQAYGDKYQEKKTHIKDSYFDQLFDENKEKFFHGKMVFNTLNKMIQDLNREIKDGTNPKITQKSIHLKVSALEKILENTSKRR